jgi:amino acid transporter
MGALCFAELGTSVASSGGEYTYINMAYGPMTSYLYIWVLVLIIVPCSNAISALTFANYCLQPLFEPNITPPEEAIRLLALAILMLLIYINCTSLDGSISLQNLFALAKVLALGSIIFYGLYYIVMGNQFKSLVDESQPKGTASVSSVAVQSSSNTSIILNGSKPSNSTTTTPQLTGWWSGTNASLPHLARAFYSGFFTYSGW